MVRVIHYFEKKRFSFLLLIIATLVVNTSGCGYKSMPVPPEDMIPNPVVDLRYELSEKGVTLTWTYPTRTAAGHKLTEITSFDIYRAVVPLSSYCESCPIPFGNPMSFPGGILPEDEAKIAVYESTLLRPDHLYFFKIKSKIGWWAESTDSNIVSFVWSIPPRAPKSLQADAGDGIIELSWQPVVEKLDGRPLNQPVKYQVYKSLGGGAFVHVGEPISETTYTDNEVINGKRYFYKIQAMGVHERGMVGGGLTVDVTSVPVDLTPPKAPTGVHALRTAKSVKVFWDKVKTDDVKEYAIYRRAANDKKSKLIDRVNAPYTLFTDNKLPTDENCLYYAVSAVDKSAAANESSLSLEVKVCKQ
ncbi:MAG: hypothetical protein OEM02_08620 [Desulfobulbaceae bacterium]|nr:hypothetical protein [Desulfobulbaceae bacterium]